MVLQEALEPAILAAINERSPAIARAESAVTRRGGHTQIDEVMTYWVLGNEDVIAWANQTLDQLGLTMEDINARAMGTLIDEMTKIDFLLGRAERCRNDLILDIERRRAAFAEALRQAAKDLDAEADEVATDAPALEHAGD